MRLLRGPNHRSSAWLELLRGPVALPFYWLIASVSSLLCISVSPVAALGLATLGGLLLGRQTGRAFEASFRREHLSAASPARAITWHWLVIGTIVLNYAWFLFADRPFVPGLLFLIALIVLRRIRTRSLFPLTPLDLPIVVLLLLAVLATAVFSVKTSLSYPKLYGIAFSILVFYEVVYGLQHKGNLIRWLVVLHLLGLAIAGLGLVGTDWFNKVADLSRVYALIPRKIVNVPRSIEGGFHRNGIAGTLIYLIPLYAVALKARLLESHRYRRLYAGLSALTLVSTVLTLILTQSRGALVGISIACLALFLAMKGRLRLSLLIVACFLLVWLLFLTSRLSIAQHPAIGEVLQSHRFRQRAWGLGLNVLEVFPLRSAGLGTFDHVARYMFPHLYCTDPRDALRGRHTTITHVHNELLQVAMDLGIPGFVAYVALLAACARTAWRVWTWAPDKRVKWLILGLSAGMLAHQVFGLTDAFLLGTKPGVVMWIVMGLVTGLYLRLAPRHLAKQD